MSTHPAPVFVLAAPYCGAARLAQRLAQHPALYALPELCLFLADRVDDLLDIYRLSQGTHGDGLLRAVAQLQFGAQRDAEVEAARDWLAQRRTSTVGELLAELAALVAPRRLVIPDSESTLRPMDLARLRRHVAGARAIHLVRHPWTQGCLMAPALKQRLFVPPDFKDHSWDPPMADPQIPWLRCNANIERAFAAAPEALRRLRLETLESAADRTRALASLCDWIGVTSTPADLESMNADGEWVFGGHGPRAAPFGLEAEMLMPAPAADRQRAAQTALDQPLPWRPDAIGFDASVIAHAQRYGYA